MTAAGLSLGIFFASAPLGAQSPEPVVSVSADSVEMAEVFELRIEVPVPEGSMVYFPDTIQATAEVESYAPVEWRARRGPDGGATLELTYPLMPFGMGPMELPSVDILTMPLDEDAEGERIPGGSLVGDWLDARPSVRYTRRVATPVVWVEPLYGTEEIMEGLAPRPPGDVLGFSWSPSAVALLLIFSTVIGGAVVTTTREWLANRDANGRPASSGPLPLTELRTRALGELERLIAAGPYAPGQAHELYVQSSGAVRGYVERLDAEWGPELTSSELMARLTARSLTDESLVAEMDKAEAVKFGRLRPDAPATEAHLRALQAWLRSSKEVRA